MFTTSIILIKKYYLLITKVDSLIKHEISQKPYTLNTVLFNKSTKCSQVYIPQNAGKNTLIIK